MCPLSVLMLGGQPVDNTIFLMSPLEKYSGLGCHINLKFRVPGLHQ